MKKIELRDGEVIDQRVLAGLRCQNQEKSGKKKDSEEDRSAGRSQTEQAVGETWTVRMGRNQLAMDIKVIDISRKPMEMG
jgi:hypothetical protein